MTDCRCKFWDGPLSGVTVTTLSPPDKLVWICDGQSPIRYECDAVDVNLDTAELTYRLVLSRDVAAFDEELIEELKGL